ncbi:MAG: HAD family phosphatase [Candidatus Bathyarchaeota archaeon]|nr:HAD family phosphatase [Candidatus Bathyarchaeum sp.]
MVKAVIFDWDGTLADTRSAVVQSFQKVLTEAGCSVSDEFIERRMGIGTKKTIIQAFRECNMRLDVSTLEKLVNTKVTMHAGLAKIVSILAGVTELLDVLHGKVKLAVATMSNRAVIDTLLPAKGIASYFEVVVSADDIANPKPDPEVFLMTAEKLGVEPKECVVVEDSVFGIEAARAANMRCIAVSSGVYSKEELQKEQPDMVVGSLAEKENILEFIFGSG